MCYRIMPQSHCLWKEEPTIPCVKHEQRVFSIHPDWLTISRYILHLAIPPRITVIIPVDLTNPEPQLVTNLQYKHIYLKALPQLQTANTNRILWQVQQQHINDINYLARDSNAIHTILKRSNATFNINKNYHNYLKRASIIIFTESIITTWVCLNRLFILHFEYTCTIQ